MLEKNGMALNACQVIAEIRYGSDVSFDAANMMDIALRECAESRLAPLGPAYVDMRGTGDDFGFVSQLLAWDEDLLREVCRGLAGLMDPQARGRLVAVPEGLGAVRVWRFTAESMVEDSVAGEM